MPRLTSSHLDAIASQSFAVIDQALPDSLASALYQRLTELDQSQSLAPARIGKGQLQHRNEEIRTDSTLWIEPNTENATEKSLLAYLDELRSDLNQSFYMGLQRTECHFAIYPPGGRYEKHIDNFRGTNSRKMTFVYYLNPDWSLEDGGELTLYHPTKPEQKIYSIEPHYNRLVLFLSEIFPHQVEISKKERRSITGWMRTDNESSFT